jgi:two-component sensor histidine kinase
MNKSPEPRLPGYFFAVWFAVALSLFSGIYLIASMGAALAGSGLAALLAAGIALILGFGLALGADGYRRWLLDRQRYTANLQAEIAQRRSAELQLRQALDEKTWLLKETHHRVKNNLVIVESIVSLQAGEARNTRFADAFDQLKKRIHSIALIHDKLYRGTDLDGVSARAYIADLLESIHDSLAFEVPEPDVAVEDLILPAKTALPVGLILTELYTNAIKYGEGGRAAAVSLVRDGDRLVLAIANQGPPPPPDYRDLPGLGLRLVDALAGQLAGRWRAEAGPPTRFSVDFPIDQGRG